ncbi:MAG: hypothetical protein ABIY47_21045 [Opitutaceae bacterium]
MSRPDRKRSFAQLAVAVFFGALAVAFLLRSFFYGYRWFSHAVEGSANFKAMTLWTLIYFVVCSAIALFAYHKPYEGDDEISVGRG